MPVVRWGLAAKLFATLVLLGAVAILVTAVLGYVRARDSLEAAILNQLTAARQTKARQVEGYFLTIRNELRVLAASKMVIDATRGFHDAIMELEDKPLPAETSRKVDDWYAAAPARRTDWTARPSAAASRAHPSRLRATPSRSPASR